MSRLALVLLTLVLLNLSVEAQGKPPRKPKFAARWGERGVDFVHLSPWTYAENWTRRDYWFVRDARAELQLRQSARITQRRTP